MAQQRGRWMLVTSTNIMITKKYLVVKPLEDLEEIIPVGTIVTAKLNTIEAAIGTYQLDLNEKQPMYLEDLDCLIELPEEDHA